MCVSSIGGHDFRDGITGGIYLRLPLPEHIHTVYGDPAYYRPMFVSGAKDGVKGGQLVVKSVRIGCGGDMEGGWRGGTERGGRRRMVR